MPLDRRAEPFDDPEWIFEAKLDGYRALAYVEEGACGLVSRYGNTFKAFRFRSLAAAISRDLVGRTAILDGEIVRPGEDGRRLFYELMRRRGPFAYYAFDLLWLDGSDLREQPLLKRKAELRKLVSVAAEVLRYVEHVQSGVELYRVVCEMDMEGIVAKRVAGLYTPERTSWVKIKNRAYSQAAGRREFFDRPERGAVSGRKVE
jgi:bifunctional non-homologous end joining protein LigD